MSGFNNGKESIGDRIRRYRKATGSVEGGYGPISASLGFTVNASITLTAADADVT